MQYMYSPESCWFDQRTKKWEPWILTSPMAGKSTLFKIVLLAVTNFFIEVRLKKIPSPFLHLDFTVSELYLKSPQTSPTS
jgi:hypothetical protein